MGAQNALKQLTLYGLYSLFGDIGPVFWALLLEVQVWMGWGPRRQHEPALGVQSTEIWAILYIAPILGIVIVAFRIYSVLGYLDPQGRVRTP